MHLLRPISALLAVPVFLVGAATPAAATTDRKCSTRVHNLYEWFSFCIYEDAEHRFGGQFSYHNGASSGWVSVTGTMVVQQCSGTGSACSTITATPISLVVYGPSDGFVNSSKKPGSFGHVYRTCVSVETSSGGRWVFNCSDFNAYTP